jgi:excisionase family DNA binding protein
MVTEYLLVEKSKLPKPGTIDYAAKRLGLSIPSTYKLVRKGKLRAFKFGRATRVTDQAIDDCIVQLERESPWHAGNAA